MNLIFLEEAFAEMVESARFYEAKSEGLGSDFLAAVQAATDRILQSSGAASLQQAKVRKRLVPGFPFSILYESHDDLILVAAVMHQRRRPGYWRKRLHR